MKTVLKNKKNKYLKKYQDLFWYLEKNKLNEISDEVLVEFVLNYGSWDAFLELIDWMGLKKVQDIFNKLTKSQRTNILPEIRHFFKLYFKNQHVL